MIEESPAPESPVTAPSGGQEPDASKRHSTPNGRHPLLFDLLALALLALATVGFFWRVVFAGDWMPAGGGDLASFLYPIYHFAASSLHNGTIPFWNPYLWSGAPFSADIQASLFYPVNLVLFLISPQVSYRSLMGLTMFHFWLAGAGTYLCFRSKVWKRHALTGYPSQSPSIRNPGSISSSFGVILPPMFASLAYMFSDFFIVHFGNMNLVAQAAWFPFIFLFFHRSLAERSLRLAALSGIFLGIAATAGHIQPILFIFLVLALDSFYHLFWAWRDRHTPQQARINTSPAFTSLALPILSLLLTLAVSVGLSAFTLLPTYATIAYTPRSDYFYTQASQYSLAPVQLLGMLVPGFFGRDPALHWGMWDRVEAGYVGITTLALALLALMSRRDRSTRFLALMAVVSLLVALGGYTILHGWIYQFVPGFGNLRAPARFIFVTSFAIAGLAGLGLDALINQPETTRKGLGTMLRIAPWIVGAVLLVAVPLALHAVITSQDKDAIIFARTSAAANGLFFFAGLLLATVLLLYLAYKSKLRPLTVGVLAVLLLFFDLSSLGSNVDVGHNDPTYGFEHPAIIDYLKSDDNLYRIDTRTEIWHMWQPDTALLHEISDIAGLINPLSVADYDQYLNQVPDRSSSLYDFLNAKYVIGAKDVPLDWDKFVPVFDEDPDLNVYLNQEAMPRAFVVNKAIFVPNHQSALDSLENPDFDPTAAVILETDTIMPKLDLKAADLPPGSASVHLESYTPNQISLRVETPSESVLVLSEVWYPGWQARVDGQATPVLRANYAFRAIGLPPGQHQVEMTYTPNLWRTGVAVSGLTLLALAGWFAFKTWNRRRQSDEHA